MYSALSRFLRPVTATALLGLFLSAPGAEATTIRVPTDQPTVTAAFAVVSPGDTVLVEAGVHAPSTTGESFPLFIPTGGVHLLGEGAGISILDAEAVHRVIHWDVAAGGTVADLTLTGGDATTGAGMFIRHGDPEVRGLLVQDNLAVNRGAGIFIRDDADPWIHHNVIWENFDADTTDNVDPHGVVFADSSTGTFENNLVGRIDGNGLLEGGIAEPLVRQNIFFENGVPSPILRGRGICWLGTGTPRVQHNLFHANQIAAILWPDGGGDFDPYEANDFDLGDEIFGNLDGDPLFVDADGGDWHLQLGSPAIDAGDPALPLDPDGTVADVGPFFFDQSSVGVAVRENRADGLALSVGPNPFRASTRVSFRVPAGRAWEAVVFDLQGRRVRELGSGDAAGGAGGGGRATTRSWDGRDDGGSPVAGGIYWVRVRTDAGSTAVPVVRLR
jgi:hypothetical protein